MVNLEKFLSQQKEAGSLDSSGQITLDPSRALEKLVQHQLPNPGLWILKLLQAAATAQALSVTDETRALTHQAWAFPTPITFDGLRLDNRFPPYEEKGRKDTSLSEKCTRWEEIRTRTLHPASLGQLWG